MWYFSNQINILRNRKRFLSLTGLGIALFTIYFLLSTTPAFAQEPPKPTEYELLAPLPGISGEVGKECVTEEGKPCATTATFIPGLFRLIIGIAGVLAVVMIIYGGIKYMSTDAFGGKSEAKGIIENALWGLILAVSAWLILVTINPNLVNFNLNIPVQKIADTTIPDNRGPESLSLTHQQAYDRLRAAGISVDPVLLEGVKQKTIDEVVNLKRSCSSCEVTVTSATGGTHRVGECSHANGYKIDLRTRDANNLNNFITSRYALIVNPATGQPILREGARVYRAPSGALYARESDHWDIVVPCP